MSTEKTNFVVIGPTGNSTVYFGVGLTKEEAWKRFCEEYPNEKKITFEQHVTAFQAHSKFYTYDAGPVTNG